MSEEQLSCDWCSALIPLHEEINIVRFEESEEEFAWEAVFCRDEHASLWVANPKAPVERPGRASDSSPGCLLALLLVLVLLLVLLGIGAITALRWLDFSGY